MIRRRFENPLSIDLRSLGCFRVALGATLFCETALQARDLVAFYTDRGVFPAENLEAIAGSGIRFSLHYWASGSVAVEATLFAAAAVASLALMVGVHTRIATMTAWVLVLSVQARNPWIFTSGYDKLLRLLLFWSIFLPLGARFSIDARRRPSAPPTSDRYVDVPGAALLLQVAAVYWVTGLKKSGLTWTGGSAVYYALHLDLYVTYAGIWLRDVGEWLRVGTHATRALELFGPFLAFVPWRTDVFRSIAVALFVGFHLTLALFLDIGLFPLVAIIGWIPFLPASFWRAVERRSGPGTRRDATAAAVATSPLLRGACLVALLYVGVFLGLHSFGAGVGGLRAMPAPLLSAGRVLGLNQYWSMFSPEVASEEHLVVFEATLADGRTLNVLSGEPTSQGLPDPPLSTYLGLRWRLWMDSLVRRTPSTRIPDRVYAANHRFLCETWNARAAPIDRALEMRSILISETAGGPPPIRRELARSECPSRGAVAGRP